jgi:hypothetical protein
MVVVNRIHCGAFWRAGHGDSGAPGGRSEYLKMELRSALGKAAAEVPHSMCAVESFFGMQQKGDAIFLRSVM